MAAFIPYGRQHITADDIAAVGQVLQSDWLTQGPNVTGFESALAEYCGSQYACAVSNGTAALHLAYLALGLAAGDICWTSPNTFLSSANAALMCGASVDFVDISPRTYNMCPDALAAKLEQADQVGKLPKIVVPVHFAGQSCDMEKIHALSKRYGFKVVEDAAHAIGGSYQGKPIGACEYSDITIFSFHPVKVMTTAEGGALLTNDAGIAERIQLLRTHGMTRDAAKMDKPSEGPWYYQMIDLGFNYRITDMQCALGISQLKQLDTFVNRRHEIARQYHELFADVLEVTTPYQDPVGRSALHLYPIVVPEAQRHDMFCYLREQKIGVNVLYIPVYLQPYYRQLGFKAGLCPQAEAYYAGAIALPMFPDLTDEQIRYVVNQVKQAVVQTQPIEA